ncbi:FAD-dependent oxidoreductase [Paraburkholderia unamae]|uniref:Succinate dehydrogenase/fumarate reductase flavoprotein subunit n=1 Tax=Paraburkholderia unamae TaxID=219649 RepID=A0ABX5KRN0_9BURK|nr:FAD-dependent oxidoreductase [Paraburkholderia unamae]PVX84230.1 succinate dehydrogenase/fumarate reductase flavoprotein subunit [Paraburkholderia unamae]
MGTQSVECDVLVIGTGASGMAAAITAQARGLNVLMVEKEARIGGTTARSGGWLWIPGTSLAKAQGIEEPEGAAARYLQHEAGKHYDAARVGAFLRHGPEAVDFFTSQTALQFDMPPVFPDYHAEAPGGLQGGRSMLTRPLDGRELGAHIGELAPPLPELTVFGMMLGSGKDIWHFMRMFRSLESFAWATRRMARHGLDVLRHGRGMTLTNGNALAGRLYRSVLDRKIAVWRSTAAQRLIVEHERVAGAWVEREGARIAVRARRGVVLACGGFPHDVSRRAQLFAHAPDGHAHHSPSPQANTGDGLRLGESTGGWVDPTIPNAAAWVPASVTTRKDGTAGVMPHFIDRAKPGVIAVTGNGRRFTNESNSYHDFVQAMVRACAGQREAGAWLICDHRTVRKYGLGCVAPAPMPIGRHLRSGYLKRGRSVAELAARIGVEPQALEGTIAQFNEPARRGEDPQFGRGSAAYNRYQGDALHEGPNPCVAPIEHGPFYAIKLVIGDIGTFAGLATNAHAQVLDRRDAPIEGLYAVGNDMASIMGGNYPGAGITLGPALTFGYVAGLHLAGALNDEACEAFAESVSSHDQ